MREWSNPQSDPLAAAAKRLLDESLHDLDRNETLLIQRARLNVLNSVSSRRPRLRWAAGMALASVVAIALTLWIWPSVGGNHPHLPLLEDLELMQSSENIELSEDLEFYDWLADGPAAMG